VEKERARKKALWYVGTADLEHDEYRVGFREVPLEDLIAGSRESDNVLKINPGLWRRWVTVIGPGAGVPETVTGMMAGLGRVRSKVIWRKRVRRYPPKFLSSLDLLISSELILSDTVMSKPSVLCQFIFSWRSLSSFLSGSVSPHVIVVPTVDDLSRGVSFNSRFMGFTFETW